MVSTEEVPYGWLPELERTVLSQNDIPLLGQCPDFPLEEFKALLQEHFGCANLEVDISNPSMTQGEEALSHLGEGAKVLSFAASSIESPFFLALAQKDYDATVELFAFPGDKKGPAVPQSLRDGFFLFCLSRVLQQFPRLSFTPEMSYQYLGSDQQPQGPALSIDVGIRAGDGSLSARLILPEAFRKEWVSYFARRPSPSQRADALSAVPDLSLSLEVGRVRMSLEEWNGVENGDFIILDRCTADPGSQKGWINLSLNGKALFRGRFKKEGIKLAQFARNQERTPSDMANEYPEDDEDLYGDEDESIEAEENLYSEDEEEQTEGFAESPEEAEDFLEDDEDEVDDEEATEEPAGQVAERELVNLDELPVEVVVEVGRLKVSAKELMSLRPGNILETSISIESPVYLVANGKPVGKGELMKLGQVLGVRVSNMGPENGNA